MKKIETIATIEDFWLCVEEVTEGFLFAMLTDEILWERWPSGENERRELRESVQRKEQKLLDIRIFDTQREARMLRGDIVLFRILFTSKSTILPSNSIRPRHQIE